LHRLGYGEFVFDDEYAVAFQRVAVSCEYLIGGDYLTHCLQQQ
jgi:hypothetical protein